MKRRRVDGMVGEATGASQAGAAHRSGLARKNSRPHGMACVGGCLGPAEQHGEEQFRAGKRDQPEAPPETAPSAQPDPTLDGQASGHGGPWNRRAPSARQVKTRHPQWSLEITLLEGVTAPHRGVAGEPGCRYALIYRDTRDRIAEGG